MKGKLLSYEEIVNLKDGAKVYLTDVNIANERILVKRGNELFANIDERTNLVLIIYSIKNLPNIKIYEWLEEPESEQTITKTEKETNTYNKTYKGSEILAMIEDGRLNNDDAIISKFDEEYLINEIKNNDFELTLLIDCSPFTIKQKPVDFMTAGNSGKSFKVEHNSFPREWRIITLQEFFEDVVNLGINSADICDIINNGKFYLSN